MRPSDQFLNKLNKANANRRLSDLDNLRGFSQDLELLEGDDNRGPIQFRDSQMTDDESCKIVAEFEVTDSSSWKTLKENILRMWNKEVAYTHSEHEFTETPEELTFHFFTFETFEDDKTLFVTGKAIFRRT